MDIRELINTLSSELDAVNKSFESKDANANGEHYAFLREVVNTINCTGIKVQIAETWEKGLVCVEVTLEKVRF